MPIRTDLAIDVNPQEFNISEGIEKKEEKDEDVTVTTVDIKNDETAEKIGKKNKLRDGRLSVACFPMRNRLYGNI